MKNILMFWILLCVHLSSWCQGAKEDHTQIDINMVFSKTNARQYRHSFCSFEVLYATSSLYRWSLVG